MYTMHINNLIFGQPISNFRETLHYQPDTLIKEMVLEVVFEVEADNNIAENITPLLNGPVTISIFKDNEEIAIFNRYNNIQDVLIEYHNSTVNSEDQSKYTALIRFSKE